MSDYLGNLIARTVSPAVAVRPQLPSLFEPAAATREVKSEPEFEQENFVEQPPVTQSSEKVAPMPLSIPTPRQSVLREPKQTVPEISRLRKILETSQKSEPAPPPTSIDHQSTPREPSRIFSRRGDGKPTPEPEAPVQPRTFRQAAQTPLRDVIVSASHEVSALEETRPSRPSVASKPVVMPEPSEPKPPKRSRVQAIVPTVRSLPPIAPLSPAAATAPPTINVTIGRVEIRAFMPRVAVPKPAPPSRLKLSLEDYLKQRNGETR